MDRLKYSYNPPWIVKRVFNQFQWESSTQNILLTFDDGPNPNTTAKILTELNKYSIKSIFFTVGENLEKYPSLAKEIISEGHEIGNHMYKHEKLTTLIKNETIYSIKKVQDIAEKELNYFIKYFRPPHGRFKVSTQKILNEFNLKNVMWSLLTYDYQNDINIVKFAVKNYLKSNSLIVLHDSNKSSDIILDSIQMIVDKASEMNYKIGKPSECLKYYS